MESKSTQRILAFVKSHGVVRPRDLTGLGVARIQLSRLVGRGLLRRVGRGLYALPNETRETISIVEAAKRVPHGVICLLSALQFHSLTTQLPPQVWIAIGEKAWKTKLDFPRMRLVRFSNLALTSGVESLKIEGVPVKVFSPAKTVADCFKYRNKIGLDVAIEALRECLRQRKCTVDDLWHYAKICRVANVMRPYLEASV